MIVVSKGGIPMTDDRNLAMIRNEDDWPVWPVLPLKQPGTGKVGLLYAGEGFTVLLTNMFFLATQKLEDISKEQYDSAEAVVAAGWVVD